MLIDPLATIIADCRQEADLASVFGTRIGESHRYGAPEGGWAREDAALVLRDEPGSTPDIDAGMQRVRWEATTWGLTPREAKQGYLYLLHYVEHHTRRIIATHNGLALFYYVVMDSGVRIDYDPDVQLHFAQTYLRGAVASEAVG